jgi:hypothetical protein
VRLTRRRAGIRLPVVGSRSHQPDAPVLMLRLCCTPPWNAPALGAGLLTPPKHEPALGAGLPTPPLSTNALGAGLLTPPKRLTDRSPSFGVSLASTNTFETWVCDERGETCRSGKPVGSGVATVTGFAEEMGYGPCTHEPYPITGDPRRAPRGRRVTPTAMPTPPYRRKMCRDDPHCI